MRGGSPSPSRGRSPHWKGTILRNEPHSATPDPSSALPSPRRSVFSPAADVIGTELDLWMTSDHLVHALTPGFCDAASVYLLERWRLEENARARADAPRVEVRRTALRIGPGALADWEAALPVGEMVAHSRRTPYARVLSDGQARVLDAVDPHTSGRLAGPGGGGDARAGDLLRVTSFLVVPLRLRGNPIGFVNCTRGPGRPPFGTADVAAVEALAARTAVALDNARRYERERRTALAIRNSLASGAAVEFGGCRAAHGCLPAGHGNLVGGDWSDVVRRPGDRVSLIVGDAMGHGPESAVAMIQLRTAVRTLAALDIPAADLVGRLDVLAGDSPGVSFATCIYAEWDARRRTCTLVGAGHPPPLLRGPRGRTAPVALAGTGLPLGLGAGSYEETVLSVPDPALLVLYSDGLVESRDADIDHEITRLAHTVDAAAAEAVDGDTQDALPSLCRKLLGATSGTAGSDDRTLLLAELTPAGS
ncbi:GAF domain-containing SpoIIE family protein phosphatase [Streptomyces sp. AK04-3B]|uniref:PP2C family protein-serine/threonine phosphatase n=1 Tax=Streptomyces sp. AK04-3B TaxID=3028650 RepID=UPI0029B4FF2D|nr:GAF domain-containing SpoIIE family protein phosphatase [Streptomyces sp. AK04-3B]MDX3800241.1 SpoIIE family protein phosphatase [Streptomyces sp. AK04-3B]